MVVARGQNTKQVAVRVGEEDVDELSRPAQVTGLTLLTGCQARNRVGKGRAHTLDASPMMIGRGSRMAELTCSVGVLVFVC